METLKQVRIFQDCEPGLLEALVLKLKLQVSQIDLSSLLLFCLFLGLNVRSIVRLLDLLLLMMPNYASDDIGDGNVQNKMRARNAFCRMHTHIATEKIDTNKSFSFRSYVTAHFIHFKKYIFVYFVFFSSFSIRRYLVRAIIFVAKVTSARKCTL